MQQVRGRVVQHRRLPARGIDARQHSFADAQRFAALPFADMAVELPTEFLRVVDDESSGHVFQRTGIADLPARLRIERRAVQDDRGRFAGLQRFHGAAVAQDRQHLAVLRFERFVAEESRRRKLAGDFGRQLRLAFELAGRARAFALGFHCPLEACHVHRHAAFTRDVGRQIHRKAIRVVETERVLAGNRLVRFRCNLVEHLHAVFQRLAETVLLGAQGFLDECLLRCEFRVGFAHLGDQRRDHLPEKFTAHAKHPTMAQCAANDPSQHVTAALVRRQHAVHDQECARADVVGDHAQRFVFVVAAAGEFLRGGDQVLEQVDLVIGVHAL